jgi:coatomer subunit beta'
LAENSTKVGRFNIAFVSSFLLGDVEKCIDLLLQTNRIPEAAFFARTYKPSQVSRIVKLWKESLALKRPLLSDALADPEEYPDLFPDFALGLDREREALESLRAQISDRSRSDSPSHVEGVVSVKPSPERPASSSVSPVRVSESKSSAASSPVRVLESELVEEEEEQ